MSELSEEKKAINDLNFIIVTDVYDNEVSIDKTKIINEYNESVGIVLNLIDKQSKEIEHWKAGMKIVEKDKNNHIERLEKEIEELKQDRDEYKEEYIKLQNARYYNYISKDKIKAMIEDLENQKRQWIEDRDNKHKDSEIIYAIEVLQSLLEGGIKC